MNTLKIIKVFFPLTIIPLFLLLNNCGSRSEYGEANDYEKLGAELIPESTPPEILSVSPTDNSTFNSPATTISVTFSETISTSSITTNTNDTTCSGSFQLSSDNFSTCIQMSAAPTSSDNDSTFTATPAANLSGGTTHKLRITTSAQDNSSNSLASTYTTNGFTTTPSGTGTITGAAKYDNGTAFSGVAVSFSIYGSKLDTDSTSGSDGNFNRASIDLGIYTLEYSKTNYKTATQTATLETNNQTLTVPTQTMISNDCNGGNISGIIKNAVTSAAISGAAISVREGLNTRSGSTVSGKTDTTNGSGAFTLSSMEAGSYTIEATKDGLITAYIDAISCSGISGKNANMSTELAVGDMRIVLSWDSSEDFDSHLEIPCNSSTSTCTGSDKNDKSHLWYNINHDDNVTYTDVSTADYHDWGSGVYVTLDQDNQDSADGPETITIGKVQSGDYRYHVHSFSEKGESNSTNLADNETVVYVYYDVNKSRTFNVPSAAGNLWTVFDYNKDSGFSTLNTMADEDTQGDVDDH